MRADGLPDSKRQANPIVNARTLRLQQRFKLILESVSFSVGKDMAFAAGAASWLMAIEHAIHASMEILAEGRNYDEGLDHPRLDEFKQEARQLLMSFHQEICIHLGVSRDEAVKLSHHWDQLLKDIYEEKG